MQVLDGKLVSRLKLQEVKTQTQAFHKKHARLPGLAVVLVGEDPASQVYVKNKVKACHEVGFYSQEIRKSATITQSELEDLLFSINEDSKIDGLLVQLPLPSHLKPERVLELMDPTKDADGLAYMNMGLMWAGRPRVKACTPKGVMAILDHYKIDPDSKTAVVVGRSNIVGKPMAQLLLEANATVTTCHKKTVDLKAFTTQADIVVVAAGVERFMGREHFKKDAVVIDVGMHRTKEGKLCGDVRFEELKDWVAAATPVPGGVGPMTIAMLLENTLELACQREGDITI